MRTTMFSSTLSYNNVNILLLYKEKIKWSYKKSISIYFSLKISIVGSFQPKKLFLENISGPLYLLVRGQLSSVLNYFNRTHSHEKSFRKPSHILNPTKISYKHYLQINGSSGFDIWVKICIRSLCRENAVHK